MPLDIQLYCRVIGWSIWGAPCDVESLDLFSGAAPALVPLRRLLRSPAWRVRAELQSSGIQSRLRRAEGVSFKHKGLRIPWAGGASAPSSTPGVPSDGLGFTSSRALKHSWEPPSSKPWKRVSEDLTVFSKLFLLWPPTPFYPTSGNTWY